MRWPHHRFALGLVVVYAALFIALAVAPHDRADWALENALALLAVVALVLTRNRFPLSRVSSALIFLFLCLHTIGAHHTYSLVPYDRWIRAATGWSLQEAMGWERNHYDRFVHFAYGLLIAYPIREFFLRVADARGFWGYFLPLDVTLSTSFLYEMIEWGAAEVFGGELGIAYLGAQGDVWDSHKDMALAALGATGAMAITAAINMALQRDFAREISESLRVKRLEPLGEEELLAALKQRSKTPPR